MLNHLSHVGHVGQRILDSVGGVLESSEQCRAENVSVVKQQTLFTSKSQKTKLDDSFTRRRTRGSRDALTDLAGCINLGLG